MPEPTRAIAEFLRVLKPGGSAWVEVPMTYPYHEAPKDYWRVTAGWLAPLDGEIRRGSVRHQLLDALAAGLRSLLPRPEADPLAGTAQRQSGGPPSSVSQARLQMPRDCSGGSRRAHNTCS